MNSTVICRACGHEIDSDVDFCYFCGADMAVNDQIEQEVLPSIKKEKVCPVCRERKSFVFLKPKAAGYYCKNCDLYIGVFEPITSLC